MGSWTEFDAVYPPGVLSPGAAFVVALAHLHGATSLYDASGALAGFVPHAGRGLVADRDLLERAEHYLADVDFDEFVAEMRERLNRDQMRCVLLNLLDAVLAVGDRPETHPRYRAIAAALDADGELTRPYRAALLLKHDLSIFPQ